MSILINLTFLVFASAQQQPYPKLYYVQTHANVTSNKDDQMYSYDYILTNSISSTGNIDELEIDIARNSNTVELDTLGLKFINDGFTEKSFRRNFAHLKGRIVPVGFTQRPPKWTAVLSDYLTSAFFTTRSYAIQPGHSLGGFEVMSEGLPTIRHCIVSPFFDEIALFPNPADTTITYYVPPIDSVRNAVKFYGWTVGPTAPPVSFVNSAWLDTLTFYTRQSTAIGWIRSESVTDKYLSSFNNAKTQLQSDNPVAARQTLQAVVTNIIGDSAGNITSEAYALLRFNTEYLISKIPIPPPSSPELNVVLKNSIGSKLLGGSLKYYDGSWKPATHNNDGTFTVNTTLKTVSLQMTYAYGVQTKSNVAVGSDTVVFQTVNAQVKLQNSQGSLIDTGTVQYYAGAWRNFGTTSNGVATMELLPINYSFRMTYAFGSNDKAQDLSANSVVMFQTTNASVQLKNSQGNLMDTGTVQYYSGAWRTVGTTVNGVASMELLPNNYSFRMTYAYGSNDKAQNIGANSTVIFQTVNAAVQLKNSQGSLIDQGTVQYYSGEWRSFGTTSGGIATKELLPNSYAFRMTYAFGSNDKTQDVGSNNTVVFSTVLANVNVINTQNNPVNNAVVTYYSGAWRSFGNTVNGTTTKELLPANLQFRAQSGSVLQNKTQDLSTNPVVVITLNVGQ